MQCRQIIAVSEHELLRSTRGRNMPRAQERALVVLLARKPPHGPVDPHEAGELTKGVPAMLQLTRCRQGAIAMRSLVLSMAILLTPESRSSRA